MGLLRFVLPLLLSRQTDPGVSQPPAQLPTAPPPHVQDLDAPKPILLPASAPLASSEPLSADEAARIALMNQPSIGIAKGNVVSARGHTNQLVSGLLPQVSAGGGIDKLGSLSGRGVRPTESPSGLLLPFLSPVDTGSAAIQIKQLIYDFDQTRNLVRQSKALETVAEGALSQTQLSVLLSVKSAFYTYLSAERLVKASQDNLENRQRQLDLAKARLDKGIGLPSDVVLAQTTKSQAILSLNQAMDTAQQDRVNLLNQMGINPLTPISVTDASEPSLPNDDVKSLVKSAVAHRPEVKVAQAGLSASKFGLSASRSLNLPSVYAAVSAGSRGEDLPFNDSTFSLQLGLQMPLYDGGQRAGAIEESKGNVSSSESQLRAAIIQVSTDVVTAYVDEKSASQSVSITANEVVNAEEGVRIAEGRYRAGLGLFLDITNAQANLLIAQQDQIVAQNSLDLARTKVRYATGQLLDAFPASSK